MIFTDKQLITPLKGRLALDKNENRKELFMQTFQMMQRKENLDNAFCKLGFEVEYDSGTYGKFSNDCVNYYDQVLLWLLGLHVEIEKVKMKPSKLATFFGDEMDLEVLYPEDRNIDWSITYDDWFALTGEAREDPEMQEMIYNAFVNRDENMREALNNKGMRKQFSHYHIGVFED